MEANAKEESSLRELAAAPPHESLRRVLVQQGGCGNIGDFIDARAYGKMEVVVPALDKHLSGQRPRHVSL